jgi:hypothetical protein
MKNPLGLALIAIGVLLLVFGFFSADSIGSELSEFFTGSPSDKAIWLLIGGVGSLIAGLFLTARTRNA